MRNVMRFSVFVGLLALPLGALAQTPTVGQVGTPDCGGTDASASMVGEAYALKADGGLNNDWLAHLFSKGAGGLGMAVGDFNGDTYQALGGNFTRPEAPTNVVVVFITLPNGQLMVDSGDLSLGFNFQDTAQTQTVGNSFTGALTLPGSDAPYSVDFGGAGAVNFPAVGTSGGNPSGINYAFSPIAEVADDGTPGNCDPGGAFADPGATNSAGGFIVGYNVYRMQGPSGAAPDQATMGAMANFAGFVPMSFDFGTADDTGLAGPQRPGATAATEGDADGDLGGLQNLDGSPYTGDEILLFQDSANLPDGMTANPFAADPTMPYWYAVQPVVRGAMADFDNVSVAKGPMQDHSLDLDGDGNDDWVDLDLDGTPEFYSPNENAGIPGLGLTHNSLPLLSPAAWVDPMNMPATDYLGLDVIANRRGVELSLNTALEAGNVLGYNVYRVSGDARELVNESLISARGGSGNTYDVVDERFQGRRARSLSYEVDVVYNDGTDARTYGPFAAEAATRGSSRRSR